MSWEEKYRFILFLLSDRAPILENGFWNTVEWERWMEREMLNFFVFFSYFLLLSFLFLSSLDSKSLKGRDLDRITLHLASLFSNGEFNWLGVDERWLIFSRLRTRSEQQEQSKISSLLLSTMILNIIPFKNCFPVRNEIDRENAIRQPRLLKPSYHGSKRRLTTVHKKTVPRLPPKDR